jgi:hypothetical protein
VYSTRDLRVEQGRTFHGPEEVFAGSHRSIRAGFVSRYQLAFKRNTRQQAIDAGFGQFHGVYSRHGWNKYEKQWGH